MKRRNLILGSVLLFGSMGTQAQIKIGNYKMNEMQNWDRAGMINTRQVAESKAVMPGSQENLLDIDVLMNVEASSFSAVFNIRQVGETAVSVNEIMDKRLSEFAAALGDIGIDKGSIVTDLISQTPIFGIEKERKLFTKTLNEVPLGFELEKNLIIRYSKYSDLERIVRIASNHEIYELVKVDFFAMDPSHYYDTMRIAAVNYAKQVVNQLKPVGIRLDTMRMNWSEQTSAIYPITRYQQYTPMSKPGYSTLLANRGSTTLETVPSPSLYYNHLAFSNFEVVLHPLVDQPVIQYVMNLKVRFSYPPEPSKLIYVLSPDGKLQPLDIH
ncbi:MAG: SIMPL domain-containing protein [Flavobacteriales bacterium]|nr:SIMPL domain-containing protein [Flavobacteriales bacterium]